MHSKCPEKQWQRMTSGRMQLQTCRIMPSTQLYLARLDQGKDVIRYRSLTRLKKLSFHPKGWRSFMGEILALHGRRSRGIFGCERILVLFSSGKLVIQKVDLNCDRNLFYHQHAILSWNGGLSLSCGANV